MCPAEKEMAPYLCYTLEDYPVRIIGLDTIVEGKHWGGISEKVANWLEAKLDEKPNKKWGTSENSRPYSYTKKSHQNNEILNK